jgi:transposase
MARRTECTSLEERIAIAEQAAAGQTDQQIANERGLSVWTVRKWRRKAQKEGRSGLTPRRGRPPTGALGSFSAIRQTLRQMREEHPGWGPVTLRLELEKQGWTGASLPSRSRIAAFLRQEGLVRPYQRRSPLPQPDPSPVRQAHEEWAVDAQGVVQTPLGPVSVINIVDEASHLLVESLARPGTSHPTQADYQLALRRGFLQRGLPQRVSMVLPPPFPLRFTYGWSLWAWGCGLSSTHPRKSTAGLSGRTERFTGRALKAKIRPMRWRSSAGWMSAGSFSTAGIPPRPWAGDRHWWPFPRLAIWGGRIVWSGRRSCWTCNGWPIIWPMAAGIGGSVPRDRWLWEAICTIWERIMPGKRWRPRLIPRPGNWSSGRKGISLPCVRRFRG